MKFVVGLIAGILALGAVSVAFGHAEPARVTPGDGAVLNQLPGEIVIEMSQEMAIRDDANDIDLINASGTEVTTVAAVIDRSNRKRISVPLPSELPVGTYTVKWKTLSAEDGDPADGSLSFTYDPAAQPSPGNETPREDLLNPDPVETPDAARPSVTIGGSDNGVTWILVVAVGLITFVLGAGGTFLLVQKKA